jgi:predicted dehydrogenase
MKNAISRRKFLQQSSVFAAGVATLGSTGSLRAAKGANDKLLLGIIGCNGRGRDHINGHLADPNVEIAYICDVDSRAVENGIALALKKQQRKPKGVKDFRSILEDKEVDAVSIAVPDHWHTPATVLACAAGKHVYIEKPGSHNAHERELIVAAADKQKRIVQMRNQRRSWT